MENRTKLRSEIQEQIGKAQNLTDLQIIYHRYMHSEKTQHQTLGSVRCDYTKTQRFLIVKLREQAHKLYSHSIVAENIEKRQLRIEEGSSQISTQDERTESQEMKDDSSQKDGTPIEKRKAYVASLADKSLGSRAELEKSTLLSAANKEESDKKEQAKSTEPLQHPLLHYLSTREKLSQAPFMSRDHDTWIRQFMAKVGDAAIWLSSWIYKPSVYTNEEKAQVRAAVKKEIEATQSVADLLTIYDRYKNAEFICERRYLAFLGKHSYPVTKTYFINQLRVKASELSENAQVDELVRLLDHPIFSKTHEGSGCLGGLKKDRRETLDAATRAKIEKSASALH